MLTGEERSLLIMATVEELPYETIAQMLEVEIGTVKSQVSRVRAKLRRIQEETGASRWRALASRRSWSGPTCPPAPPDTVAARFSRPVHPRRSPPLVREPGGAHSVIPVICIMFISEVMRAGRRYG